MSEELGVRYVLEGSLRKVGNRVRITAQLIDALSGRHIWSERYDREVKDILILQDEIMREILTEMQVKLTEGEQARSWRSKKLKTGNRKAWQARMKTWQARSHFFRMNPEGYAMARQLAEESIEIEPNVAGYVYLAFIYLADISSGRSKSPRKSMELAEECAQKALQLDDSQPMARITLGQIYLYKRQHEKAIAEGEKALALDPNGAEVHNHLGYFLRMAGRSEEAIPLFKKAIRLNPYPPSFYYSRLGSAYATTGRYDEAVAACKKALKRQPNDMPALILLAILYSSQGLEEEARVYAGKVLRIAPNFSVERFAKALPFKDKATNERIIGALRNAGLK
ncbi:MAG: tetratricopeptide repeat protein [Desulfobacteraceae bacterium]|nr:tetratricopeptide repeat protein [Desulfobacteraceae bacterium]